MLLGLLRAALWALRCTLGAVLLRPAIDALAQAACSVVCEGRPTCCRCVQGPPVFDLVRLLPGSHPTTSLQVAVNPRFLPAYMQVGMESDLMVQASLGNCTADACCNAA